MQAVMMSSRLELRAITEADLDDAFTLWSDPELYTYYPEQRCEDLEEARRRIAICVQEWRDNECGTMVVRDRETGEFIGHVRASLTPDNRVYRATTTTGRVVFNLSYRLLRQHHGRRFVTESVRTMMREIEAIMRNPVFHIAVASEDEPGARVALRLGLVHQPSIDEPGVKHFFSVADAEILAR